MDALRAKPYWQKVLIFGAGCLNNLLTAVAVYFFMAWIGHYGPEPIPPVIESIDPSVEARVEIRAGDRIVAVSDEPVDKYTDFITGFEKYARAYKANAVPLTVVRDGTTQSLLLSAWLIPGFSPDEDRLVAVGDRGVTSVKRAGEAAAKLFGKAGEVAVTIERDGKKRVEQVPPAAAAGYQWPLLALEAERVPFIAMPIPNLPAERAGIRGGDMIIAIDGKPVRTCVQAIDFIRASIGKEIEIQVRREVAGGKIETLAFRLTVRPDPENESRGQIGVSFSQPITHKYQRPAGEAFVQAVESTFAISFAYLNAVRDLLSSSFQTIRENIGGPIAIGRHTYDVAQRGATWFFDFFAMFNIILAVTNLLPLPIFDGGHILFATIEAIIRRPLPAKILVRIYNVFIVLIIGLAVVISFNDVIMNFWRVF
jgi:regulator of sigma E protease